MLEKYVQANRRASGNTNPGVSASQSEVRWVYLANESRLGALKSRVYMMTHLLSSRSFLTLRATRAASVKASLTPRLRMAEHSR